MRVTWTPEAGQDRREIWDFLFDKNPQAAADMDRRFGIAAAGLAQNPEIAPQVESLERVRSFPIRVTGSFINLSQTW